MTLMEWLALVLLVSGSVLVFRELLAADDLEQRMRQSRPAKGRKACR